MQTANKPSRKGKRHWQWMLMNLLPSKREFKSRRPSNVMLSKPKFSKQSHLHWRLLGAASVAPKWTNIQKVFVLSGAECRLERLCLQTASPALQTAPDTAAAARPQGSHWFRGFPGVSFTAIAAETLRGAQMSCLNLHVNWYFHRGLRQTFQISQFPLLKNQSDNSNTKRNTQRQRARCTSFVSRHSNNTEQKVRWRWATQVPTIPFFQQDALFNEAQPKHYTR